MSTTKDSAEANQQDELEALKEQHLKGTLMVKRTHGRLWKDMRFMEWTIVAFFILSGFIYIADSLMVTNADKFYGLLIPLVASLSVYLLCKSSNRQLYSSACDRIDEREERDIRACNFLLSVVYDAIKITQKVNAYLNISIESGDSRRVAGFTITVNELLNKVEQRLESLFEPSIYNNVKSPPGFHTAGVFHIICEIKCKLKMLEKQGVELDIIRGQDLQRDTQELLEELNKLYEKFKNDRDFSTSLKAGKA